MTTERTGRLILPLAIVLHLVTAWSSSGFYAADEHYQVITFAEVKAGHEPASELPWEYAHRIRCTVLPAATLVVFGTAELTGLHDPFLRAFLLRLITALVALFLVHRWIPVAEKLLPAGLHTAFRWTSWFLWFIPFLHVRFTSETWSGLLFLAAATDLLKGPLVGHKALRVGVCLGLATMVRPSVAWMAAGLLAWAWHDQRLKGRGAMDLLAGAIMTTAAMVALDSWWYGAPTFTLWNYTAMGLSGRPGGGFDAMPWWAYGRMVVKDMLPPFGLLALGAFALLWMKRPSGPLPWVLTPFLLFHVLVPHKEMRFLFPLVDLMPLLLMQALALVPPRMVRRGTALRGAVVLLVSVDLAGLAVASLAPAGSGRTRLAQRLGEEVGTIGYDADRTTVWKIAIPVFYGGAGLPEEHLRPLCTGAPALVISRNGGPCERLNVERIATADPWWADVLLRAYRWRPEDRGWAAYRVTAGR